MLDQPGVQVAAANAKAAVRVLDGARGLPGSLPAEEGRLGYVEFGKNLGKGQQGHAVAGDLRAVIGCTPAG